MVSVTPLLFVFPSRHSRNPRFTEAAPQVFILLNHEEEERGARIRQERREKEENPWGTGLLWGREIVRQRERERGGEVIIRKENRQDQPSKGREAKR